MVSGLFALLLAPGLVISEAQAASLSGTIRERGTGDPIEGAWVQCGDVQVFTDRAGRFRTFWVGHPRTGVDAEGDDADLGAYSGEFDRRVAQLLR